MKRFLCTLVMLGYAMMAGAAVGAKSTGIRLTGDPSPNEKLTKEALQRFLSTSDGDEMSQFVRTWRNPGHEIQQVERFTSTSLESKKPKYLFLLEDYILKLSMLNLLLYPKSSTPLNVPVGTAETSHDLSLVDGRCAWAFEQVMNITLPPVTRKNSPEHAQARTLMFEELVRVDLDWKAFIFLLIKSALPVNQEEKLVLVGNTTTPFPVVNALAHDRQVAVRLAAAQHPYIDSLVLDKMIDHDPDEAIRKTLEPKRYLVRGGIDLFLAAQKTEAMTSWLLRHPIKTLYAGQEQPALLPFDLAIEEHLSAMRAGWTAKASLKVGEPGPQTLAEAAELLVKTLSLPDYPAFCTEGANTFYCSASTSLEPGADLNSGFAIEQGGTTIYSWEAPQK